MQPIESTLISAHQGEAIQVSTSGAIGTVNIKLLLVVDVACLHVDRNFIFKRTIEKY